MELTPRQRALLDYDENFERYWNGVFTEYRLPQYEDHMWLIGASSYVFSVEGHKFAVDLQIRRQKDIDRVQEHLLDDVSGLSFILLTHDHVDHMCIPLMQMLKDTQIKWYLPYGCNMGKVKNSGLKEENIIWVHDKDVFELDGLRIRAFSSAHVREDKSNLGYVELGYEIVTPKGKIVMPCDIRNYCEDIYPDFREVDICIAHVWGGNNSLDESDYGPMLDKFVDRFTGFNAKRYFLGHLYEIGREENVMWHHGHCEYIIPRMMKRLPECRIEIPTLGGKYRLFDKKN